MATMNESRLRAPFVLTLMVACGTSGDATGGNGNWTSRLRAAPVPASAGGLSSTTIDLSWDPPAGGAPTEYRVSVVDTRTGQTRVEKATAPTLRVSELKSNTAYRFELTACASSCAAGADTTITAETAAEVWQLVGTGRGISGLSKTVSDGNVRIHAFRYGDDAPAELSGRIGLYYGPASQTVRGLIVGGTTAPSSEADPSTYLSFQSYADNSGLRNPSQPSTWISQVNAGQAIPLSASMGGAIRLFFEAQGTDRATRIQWIDSKDGYVGRDFNAGAATYCSTREDYEPSGGCAPTMAIGVEGDKVLPNPKIANARQFKIGLPTLTDWRWDGAVGTFMLFTTDAITGCGGGQANHAYAQWDGTNWVVAYAADGCPKRFLNAQAAHPVHLGEGRYKMYYGDTSDMTGRVETSKLPFLGPKKVLYGDATRTGNAGTVEYEDWETVAEARGVTFLWPDGTELDAKDEGYIDDFTYVMPTGKLSLQVMYLAITDGTVPPFTASAVLKNP